MLIEFRKIIATAQETFITLRRDQIFYPALIITVLIFLIASFVAEWSVDDIRIIFFNFSQTLFRLSGDILALLFGTKILQDAKADGSIETSLSRPIGRGSWVLGKYLGLASCLILFGVSAGLSWKLIDFIFSMGIPSDLLFWGIGFAICEWLIVAAVSVFFSTIGGFGSALFASSMLWILGLLAGAIASSFSGDNEGFDFVNLVDKVAIFWNFDRFTLIHYSRELSLPSLNFLTSSLMYGFSLCAVFLTGSTIAIKTRDAIK
jgi:ABC-type transport system involved in multi-copper enzyme maturation permease subunit